MLSVSGSHETLIELIDPVDASPAMGPGFVVSVKGVTSEVTS